MTIRFIGPLLCSGLLALATMTGVEAQTGGTKPAGVTTIKSSKSNTGAAKGAPAGEQCERDVKRKKMPGTSDGCPPGYVAVEFVFIQFAGRKKGTGDPGASAPSRTTVVRPPGYRPGRVGYSVGSTDARK
jgi:hypothetical protein